jgi:hypothetical protein
MYYMGNANNKLSSPPPPYALTSSLHPAPWANQISTPFLAKGGKAKHKGMAKVHMNRNELDVLDHIQGGPEHGPEGVRVYSHLEELLKNPHIVRNVHHHAQQHAHHHASGGIEHLREGGRFGDNEIAMIGPNTHRLFNQLAGHPTRNPNTGHPEYWSIGPALGGMFNSIASKAPGMLSSAASGMGRLASSAASGLGSAARAAAPMVQNAASGVGKALQSDQFKNFATGALNATQPLIQNALNKNLGEDWGGVAGAIGKTAQDQYLGQGDPNSMWNQLGTATGTSINKYNQGYTPQQAAGYGMSQFGQDVGGNMGQGLQGFGNMMSQGQGMGGYQMPSRQDMYNSMNSPNARNAVQDIGTNLIRGGWGGGQQAARGQMNQYMQRMMPQPANRSMNPYQGYGMQGGYNQGYNQYNPYEEENYMYG